MTINAEALASDANLKRLSSRAHSLFLTLLPYACYGGIPGNVKQLAGFTVPRFKAPALAKLWPEIDSFFERRHEWFYLLPQPWLTITLHVAEEGRQPLRRLMGRLLGLWGPACVYCGARDTDLHIDHIVPFSRGGRNVLSNLTLACPSCNIAKGAQTAAEFGHPNVQERAARGR